MSEWPLALPWPGPPVATTGDPYKRSRDAAIAERDAAVAAAESANARADRVEQSSMTMRAALILSHTVLGNNIAAMKDAILDASEIRDNIAKLIGVKDDGTSGS